MSEVEGLKRELLAAQELLFLVLDHIGEPVELDVDAARKAMTKNRKIDLDLNTEENIWVLQVVTEE